jgi:DNA-directed RNA polymerase specialized sigma24 family protein
LQIPADVTREELAILGVVAIRVYQAVDDPIDKFILAMHYELGYSKTEVAMALGISSPAITVRDQKIKKKLAVAFKKELN